MINLRPYQYDAISAIKDTFTKEFRQYVEMPTGSGKTVTFLAYAKENHDRVLIIVPSKQLLKQIYESALIFYDSKEITRKGDHYNEPVGKIHICIVHSIRDDYLNYLCSHNFDLIIIDEAHHSQSESYKRFIKNYSSRFADPKILGVTATPDRLDGQMLNHIIGVCSFRLTIEEMIQQRYLCDIEGFSVKTKIDLSDIDDHNGDFSLVQLYKKLCTESRNNMIVDIIKNEMNGRKTIVFCINIDHSKIIQNLLHVTGIAAAHIDGTMKTDQKTSILNSFRNGEISCLCNCQLLSEGFDEPSIDAIILSRPTKSKSLFIQMIGRGLRNYPEKKNCKIIDIVDNHKFLVGFNQLISDDILPQIHAFKSFAEIKKHVGRETLKITEFHIERTNLLSKCRFEDLEALPSMITYLQDNNINFFEPLTLDEATFLIWYNKLKKEYLYGVNR